MDTSMANKGLTEDKLRAIIQRYHDEDIPLDAFTFDLDWMFWAHEPTYPYSQFKWNLTKFPGMKATLRMKRS